MINSTSILQKITKNRCVVIKFLKCKIEMLCCGEDLGMVPACVIPIMNHLRILGLRIQRMPDDPKKEFMHPGSYGYLTVCTPSVHDTSTLR
jgi:4-alpha-glucanotransferase